MRLLYVRTDFGIQPGGTKGASIHLRAITAGLSALGHEVLLLSPRDGPDESHPARRLLPSGYEPIEGWVGDLRQWLTHRAVDPAVCGEIRSLMYNVWAGRRADAVLRDAPPSTILERLSLFGHVGVDLAQTLNVPLIVEVNALLTEEAGRFRSLRLQDLARQIEQSVLENATAVIAVSGALADAIAARGVPRTKLHVIPNGADVRLFAEAPGRLECREAVGLDGEFVVGFAGSLKVWHGVDVLLAAFERLYQEDPSARLLIVGSGPMETALREQAQGIGGGRAVIFAGSVPHERMPMMLRSMDVAVAPFSAVEGFYFSPIKLFEYMAAGACVVASRLGQIAEVVEDGVNGLLCAPDDVADLHAALDRARGSAPLRQGLAAAALSTVRAQYTWQHTARRTAEVIEQTLAGWTGTPAAAGTPDSGLGKHDPSEPLVQSTRPEASANIRIGYLLRMYPRFSQTFVVNEMLELERQGAHLSILSLRKPTDGMFQESVSRVRAKAHYVPETFLEDFRRSLGLHGDQLRLAPRAYARALKTVLRFRDVTWIDLLQALHMMRWVKKHRVSHVHVHFGTNEAAVAMLARMMGGPTYSLTLHAFDIFRDNVDRRLLAAKINASTFTVTVSEFNRRFLVDQVPGVRPERVRVNYNGIDLGLFRDEGQARDSRSVLAVGRLIEKKGFSDLVKALASLKADGLGMKCEIIGDGPDESKLKGLIRELGLREEVRLAGPLSQPQIRERLQRAGCLVLPCVQARDGNADALPTVLLESLASGCPSVSTRLGGVPEIIEDGVSGLLVPPGDSPALAEAVRRIVGDPALAARLRDQGRRRAEERFDVRRNVAVMHQWFAGGVEPDETSSRFQKGIL